MLQLNSIRGPSTHVRRRADRCWVTKLKSVDGLIRFRVTPYGNQFQHKSKSKRLVVIDVEQGTATCVDYLSGEPCQANCDYVLETGEVKTPCLCCHVYSVLRRLKVFEQSAVAA